MRRRAGGVVEEIIQRVHYAAIARGFGGRERVGKKSLWYHAQARCSVSCVTALLRKNHDAPVVTARHHHRGRPEGKFGPRPAPGRASGGTERGHRLGAPAAEPEGPVCAEYAHIKPPPHCTAHGFAWRPTKPRFAWRPGTNHGRKPLYNTLQKAKFCTNSCTKSQPKATESNRKLPQAAASCRCSLLAARAARAHGHCEHGLFHSTKTGLEPAPAGRPPGDMPGRPP